MNFTIHGGTTPRFTATLKDDLGVVIAASSLTTFKITLLDMATRAVINSRDRQNALNVNNVTISEAGALVWLIQTADLPATVESYYQVVFEWTWNSGAKAGWDDAVFRIAPVPRP